jgi:DNA polymerase-3 subunit epsilon
MTQPGLSALPTGTLLDRALLHLREGPAESAAIARDILGLGRAPALVADRLAAALLGNDPRVRRDHLGRWHLASEPHATTALGDLVFAVVDVETTGCRAGADDRITEIAVVRVGPSGSVDLVLDRLVNPERAIPPFVTRLTRISDGMVRSQPTFAEIADDVLDALAGRVFVAHNAQFDWRFVDSEVRRARDLKLDGPRVCTVKLARRLIPGLKNRGLDSVSRYFGIEIENRHRAGADALATARILVRLLERASEQGARTVDDVTRVPAARTRRKSASPGWVGEI